MPQVKGIQFILWVVFIVSMPLRMYTNYIAFAALGLGVLRHAGIPKFNMEYLQSVMFNENLQLIPYAGLAAMLGAQNLIIYAPLALHGVLIMGEISIGAQGPGPLSFVP